MGLAMLRVGPRALREVVASPPVARRGRKQPRRAKPFKPATHLRPPMLRPAAPVLLALATLVAGCTGLPVAPPGGSDTDALVPVGEPLVQDHEHTDPALHTGAANLAPVGYHSGYGSGATTDLPEGQGFSELAVWQGERDGEVRTLVALGRRNGPDGGFSLLDATDPGNVTLLAQYAGLANYDVEFSADGMYAFFTTQWLPTEQQTGQPDPAQDQRGVYIVDLADLSNPAAVGFFYPPTRGAHTITYYEHEGRELLMVNSYDFLPDPSLHLPIPGLGANPIAHRVFLTEFVRGPAPHLEVLGQYSTLAEFAPGETHFPHDTHVQVHPVTGDLLLYVAYWDLGCILLDIDDPANPVEVGRLTDFQPSQHNSVHFCRPAEELVDGVHVTVTEPELGPTEETGVYAVFDTTDPANPQRLGYWELPGDIVITEGLNFSPHNFDLENGRMYLAHYHGGVWVVDLSTRALLDRPASLAYYQRAVLPEDRGFLAPDFWSAFYLDGRIWASDISAGLQVLRFPLDPAPGQA